MTEAQARELVSAAFVAGWAAAQPTVPLAIENEVMPSADSFALLTITFTTSRQMTQGARGNRRIQRNGWVVVKLWGPANAGSAGVAALADSVRSIIEVVDLPSPNPHDETLTTQAANSMPVGVDGRWYMQLVRTPFWYAETK